ncbi:MAG: glycosyltransferase family 39 protein [bacterium]|nr:glycosyltransferase family 39 protein [bacterium]
MKMSLSFTIPRSKLIYLLPSLFVFLYVLIRAIRLDITYDEAWTLIDFVPQSVIHILNFTPCDANNHILNSLSIKFLYSFLPHTVFVARVPNVISLIIFLVYSYKICNLFFTGSLSVATFLILILNPFALDFFGLARGYGISLACEMASLYFIFLFLKENSPRSLLLSLLWAALTVLSGLSTLNFYMGLIGSFALYTLIVQRKTFLRNFIVAILASGALVVIVWEPIRKLIETNSLYYGGETGFYQDTLRSLAKYTLYSQEDSIYLMRAADLFFLLFLLIVAFSLFKRSSSFTLQLFTLGILIISSAAVIVQHKVLGSLYIIDRTALFFFPLLILSFCFSVQNINQKKMRTTLALILSAVFVFNFTIHANLHKTVTWYFDSHTKEILEKINEEGRVKHTVQKIDYSWPFESGVHFYLKEKNYPYVEIVKAGYVELNPEFDFYIYLGGTLDRIGYKPAEQFIVKADKDTVLAFESEKVFLFRNRKKIVH